MAEQNGEKTIKIKLVRTRCWRNRTMKPYAA
jgi:hypothetical protein